MILVLLFLRIMDFFSCNTERFLHGMIVFLLKSELLIKVHEAVWTEVQQRRPCAVYQVAVRASDDPQTGDQHDARASSPTYQPPQVRKCSHLLQMHQ